MNSYVSHFSETYLKTFIFCIRTKQNTIIKNNNITFPVNIYLFKVNKRNTRKRCEICSKLTIKTPERRRSGVFIVKFEHISHLFLVTIVEFEQVNMLAGI